MFKVKKIDIFILVLIIFSIIFILRPQSQKDVGYIIQIENNSTKYEEIYKMQELVALREMNFKMADNGNAQAYITSDEKIEETEEYIKRKTTKTLPNNDVFESYKFEFSGAGETDIIETLSIEGTSGKAYYYAGEYWVETDLFAPIPKDKTLYIRTDKQDLIISPAFHYEQFENASIEEKPEFLKSIQFVNNGNNIDILMKMTNNESIEAHFWYLKSDEQLIHIEEDVQKFIWSSYISNDDQRWCYDGYYYRSPSTYEPYSEDMFWRNPAAYVVNSFTKTRGSRASENLSYAMLDTLIQHIVDDGYFKTYPKSRDFLYEDYKLDGGFYDTRFNIDITKTFLIAYDYTGYQKFYDSAIGQIEFFINFLNNHNYDVTKDGKYGILVEDYYHENQDYTKTHSSLNHHLAEIYVLYMMYERTDDMMYLDYAEKMMQGVRNTRDMWIMPDNGLEYAYMPDGTMGLVDYPYLTYNDLYDVQIIREKLGLGRDADLDYLMSKKRTQMDKKGITQYKK